MGRRCLSYNTRIRKPNAQNALKIWRLASEQIRQRVLPHIKLHKWMTTPNWWWDWWDSCTVHTYMKFFKTSWGRKQNIDPFLTNLLFWWRSRRIRRESPPMLAGMPFSKFFAVVTVKIANTHTHQKIFQVRLKYLMAII